MRHSTLLHAAGVLFSLFASTSPLLAYTEEQQPAQRTICSLPAERISLIADGAGAVRSGNGLLKGESVYLRQRGAEMIEYRDVAAARHFFIRAASEGDPCATLEAAETFDPHMMARWGVIGMKPDPRAALWGYEKALKAGIDAAKPRIERLRCNLYGTGCGAFGNPDQGPT